MNPFVSRTACGPLYARKQMLPWQSITDDFCLVIFHVCRVIHIYIIFRIVLRNFQIALNHKKIDLFMKALGCSTPILLH